MEQSDVSPLNPQWNRDRDCRKEGSIDCRKEGKLSHTCFFIAGVLSPAWSTGSPGEDSRCSPSTFERDVLSADISNTPASQDSDVQGPVPGLKEVETLYALAYFKLILKSFI